MYDLTFFTGEDWFYISCSVEFIAAFLKRNLALRWSIAAKNENLCGALGVEKLIEFGTPIYASPKWVNPNICAIRKDFTFCIYKKLIIFFPPALSSICVLT